MLLSGWQLSFAAGPINQKGEEYEEKQTAKRVTN
jgi:hypothetical protein